MLDDVRLSVRRDSWFGVFGDALDGSDSCETWVRAILLRVYAEVQCNVARALLSTAIASFGLY